MAIVKLFGFYANAINAGIIFKGTVKKAKLYHRNINLTFFSF